ncbi:MAG: PAS domain-containing protein [Pseudomonadota bacterium]
MHNRTSQILFDYWNTVRDGRTAPQRIEIDPSALSKILSQTIILEVSDTNNLPFRIAGTTVCEFLGAEMRGRNFMELWTQSDRRKLQSTFDAALATGLPITANVSSRAFGNAVQTSELLLLPLHDHREQPTRLLGSWSQESPPTQIGISGRVVKQHSLSALSSSWPSGKIDPPATFEATAIEPPPTLFSNMGMRIVRRERRQFGVLDGGRTD